MWKLSKASDLVRTPFRPWIYYVMLDLLCPLCQGRRRMLVTTTALPKARTAPVSVNWYICGVDFKRGRYYLLMIWGL